MGPTSWVGAALGRCQCQQRHPLNLTGQVATWWGKLRAPAGTGGVRSLLWRNSSTSRGAYQDWQRGPVWQGSSINWRCLLGQAGQGASLKGLWWQPRVYSRTGRVGEVVFNEHQQGQIHRSIWSEVSSASKLDRESQKRHLPALSQVGRKWPKRKKKKWHQPDPLYPEKVTTDPCSLGTCSKIS